MANTYYIALTGSDTFAGTIGSPWKTLAKASTTLVAADVLYIRGGTYTERGINWLPTTGTELSPITVMAYPGETVIYDGASALNGWLVAGTSGASQWTTFRDLTIQNFGVRGGAPSGSGIWFGYPGSGTTWGHGNKVLSCTFINIGSSLAQDHGFYVSYGQQSVTVANCIFRNIAAGCIHTAHAPGVQGMKVYNNMCFQGHWGLITASDGASAVHATNNLFAACSAGINMVYAGEKDNPTYPASGTIEMKIHNNIFYGNTIAINRAGNDVLTSATNNLFYNNGSIGFPGTTTVLTDPLFVNYLADGTGDYHLSAGSPAIDAGTSTLATAFDRSGASRPVGTLFDIGPYEYQSPAPVNPPPNESYSGGSFRKFFKR